MGRYHGIISTYAANHLNIYEKVGFIISRTRRSGECPNREEKKMAVFTGAGVAITTPFKTSGEVDFEKFSEQIEYQIQNGTDAIVVCGTTGEAATLSHEEHIAVIEHCVKQVAGRIPVVAGTGSNATDTAVFLSQAAEKVGADALLIVTPYYNKCTQKGLYEHFEIVAKSVKIPIILYNIPGRTGGVNIAPDTVVSLCKNIDNIVGVKDATDNFSQIARLMAMADGCVDLYSGNDNQTLPMLALGAKGVISVLSNVAPMQTHELVSKFMAGDLNGSRELQLRSIRLIDALFSEVNPIPVKKAMKLQGRDTGFLRRPLTEMEKGNAEKLANAMKEYCIM